jgi:hypothetical protein
MPLVWSGLRVRAGIASGVEAGDVVLNKQRCAATMHRWPLIHLNPCHSCSGRHTYGGRVAAAAKATCDAAQGGCTLLHESCFQQAPVERLAAAGVQIIHFGRHVLKGDEGSHNVFAAMPARLCARLPLLGPPPVRSGSCLLPGFLSAPTGQVSAVFIGIQNTGES